MKYEDYYCFKLQKVRSKAVWESSDKMLLGKICQFVETESFGRNTLALINLLLGNGFLGSKWNLSSKRETECTE